MRIPFVEYLGIKPEEDGLVLEPKKELENHIGTIHASAQFTLAETASGIFLQKAFPHIGEVLPLLRGSTVKYKSPATTKLIAHATIIQEDKDKFIEQFNKRGKGSIRVMVNVLDTHSVITMRGEFNWFIQQVRL